MNFKLLTAFGFLVTSVSTGFLLLNHQTTSTPVTVNTAALEETLVAKPTTLSLSSTKKIQKLHVPSSQVVFLNGPIFENAKEISEQLRSKAKSNADVYLLIDSPGGSVLDGAAIISTMEASPVKIHTVCMGLCASMAFIIHQYGSTRLALDRAILMAHPAAGGVQGTLEQMNSRLSTITRYVDKMNAYIAKRTNMSLGDFKALYISEFWVDAEDALAKKFLDAVVDVTTSAKSESAVQLFSPSQHFRVKENINLTW